VDSHPFYNRPQWNFAKLTADAEGLVDNLIDYIHHFSANVRDAVEFCRLPTLIADLDKNDRLWSTMTCWTREAPFRSGGRGSASTQVVIGTSDRGRGLP
jgi:hypothetical protein